MFIKQRIIWLLGLLLFSTAHAEIIVTYDANFPESHKVPFQYAVDIWNQLIDTTADDVEIQEILEVQLRATVPAQLPMPYSELILELMFSQTR